VGVGVLPGPGGGDDLVERGVSGLPIKIAFDNFRRWRLDRAGGSGSPGRRGKLSQRYCAGDAEDGVD